MNICKVVASVLGVFVTAGVVSAAEPTVSVDTVTTGEPWSMITVNYTLAGVDADLDYKVAFDVTAKDMTRGVTNAPTKLANQAYVKVIDTAALFGTAKSDPKAKVRVSLIAVKSQSGSESEHVGVQLWENGPYWAECNVGATKPEESGYYFWWGDTVGYKRNAANNGWVSFEGYTSFYFYDDCPTYDMSKSELLSAGYIDSMGNLVAAHDAAATHWGGGWRMPTDAEFDALISNCTTTWTTRNGVYGRLVTGKGDYASKSIFLPAAGYGDDSALDFLGSYGLYWSSTPSSGDSNDAWHLSFYSSGFYRGSSHRFYGQSVRPLRGFAK